MNFPPFWARASRGDYISWRWSFQSAAEAQKLAEEAARQLEDRIKRGESPPKHGTYYPGRPFREQVLREIRNRAGETAAVITRNSYGCLVLNTARIMFVDVDLTESKPGLLKKFFGKSETGKSDTAANDAIAKAEAWARTHPEWGWRIYRTRAGLRLLATHALFEPETAVSDGVFDALSADPMYRQLCKAQKCFRARLTPKPWRCGFHDKPERWPWVNAKAEASFKSWEIQYEKATRDRATCEWLRTIGNQNVHPDVQTIVELHDESTRATSKMQLA